MMLNQPVYSVSDYKLLKNGTIKVRLKNENIDTEDESSFRSSKLMKEITQLGSIALANHLKIDAQLCNVVQTKINKSQEESIGSDFMEVKLKVVDHTNALGSVAAVVRDDSSHLVYVIEIEYEIVR